MATGRIPSVQNASTLAGTTLATNVTASSLTSFGATPTLTTPLITTMTTTGDVLYASAASTPARLGIGSSGQVLTVASGLPSWATAGGTTLISTTTMSGASVTLSSIPQTYTYLLLVFNEFTNSTGDGYFRINPNGAGTNARSVALYSIGTATNSAIPLQTQATYDRTNADNASAITIYNYTAANDYNKPFIWVGNYYPNNTMMLSGILSESAGALTSLVLTNTGGNWAGGTTYFYGVK